MKPLPLPLRIAAGLAVTAAEHARDLPKQLLGLPVTVLSQVLQFSMRLQQQLTELAIKGDEALSSLHPAEETPGWATFDEDVRPPASDNGHRTEPLPVPGQGDPWEQEERALAEDHTEGEFDSTSSPAGVEEEVTESTPDITPVGVTNYDDLTLPQLRARLRRFSLSELETLLSYERTHANRPAFVGMLTRRIGNVQRLAEESTDNGRQ